MNYVKTALLLSGMTGLFLAIGYLLGGQSGMVVAFAVALAVVVLMSVVRRRRRLRAIVGVVPVGMLAEVGLYLDVLEAFALAGRPKPAHVSPLTHVATVASVRPGVNGTVTSYPAAFAACSTAAHPPRTIMSAREIFFPPDCASLIAFRTLSRPSSTLESCSGWLASQVLCGANRIRAPLAPPRLSEPRNVEAADQAV